MVLHMLAWGAAEREREGRGINITMILLFGSLVKLLMRNMEELSKCAKECWEFLAFLCCKDFFVVARFDF